MSTGALFGRFYIYQPTVCVEQTPLRCSTHVDATYFTITVVYFVRDGSVQLVALDYCCFQRENLLLRNAAVDDTSRLGGPPEIMYL